MNLTNINEITYESLNDFFRQNVDAIVAVDIEKADYHVVQKHGFFDEFINENGNYHDLIEKLWFHINESGEQITKDYHVFIPSLGKVQGKVSRRLKIVYQEISHVVQMTIYPVEGTQIYIIALDELHDSEYEGELQTNTKVNTIQNTYLFSMYVDLVKDITSSISITSEFAQKQTLRLHSDVLNAEPAF